MNRLIEEQDKRLAYIIDEAWEIVFERIASKMLTVENEASLQHHFAMILFQLGTIYCIVPSERFEIELEHGCTNEELGENKDGKRKNIDIVCKLGNVKAAIELKFFKDDVYALNCYDALVDVQRLQKFKGFEIGKFFCLADSDYYTKEKTNSKGYIKIVSLENTMEYKAGTTIPPSGDKSRSAPIKFKHDFVCNWVSKEGTDWHYLKIDIP